MTINQGVSAWQGSNFGLFIDFWPWFEQLLKRTVTLLKNSDLRITIMQLQDLLAFIWLQPGRLTCTSENTLRLRNIIIGRLHQTGV